MRAIEPLTLLSQSSLDPLASPGFPGAAIFRRTPFFWKGWHGSEDAKTAKTTATPSRESRRL